LASIRRFEVRWTLVAADDLDRTLTYLETENPSAASDVGERLYAAVESLETMPARGRVVPELARFSIADYRELIVRPYRIVYRITGAVVHVHGVLDGRRTLKPLLLERLLSAR
jgi:toxin ParE1/3/4